MKPRLKNLRHENPLVEAEKAKILREKNPKMTHADVGEQIGKARSSVSNALRLEKLPKYVQEHIYFGRLREAHGIALLRYNDFPQLQHEIVKLVLQNGTSAGALEGRLPFRDILCGAIPGSSPMLVDCKNAIGVNWAKLLKKHPEKFLTLRKRDRSILELYCVDIDWAQALIEKSCRDDRK